MVYNIIHMSLILKRRVVELMLDFTESVLQLLAFAGNSSGDALCFNNEDTESSEDEVIYLAGLFVER